MGEKGDTVTALAKVSADNNVATEDKSEAFTEKNAEKDEVKDVEELSKEADEKDTENMDIDREEVKESNKDEERKAEQESKGAKEKQETKFDVMEEETAEKTDKDKEKVEDVANIQKDEKEKHEEHEVEKGSKESDKSEGGAQKKDRKRKRQVEVKKDLEPKTPLTPRIERPVRQRKSVERLVASIEGEVTKEIYIEKGRGTALKDIPNVAYKLSKRKTDDTLKLLHTILFGRRGKAAQFKSNISQFSGFVWHENEEKQKMKLKEKLDKCVKEKLLELCDVLDIPVDKDTSRKEDLESQLMDFLDAPHPTTSELLAEKDKSSKGKKCEKASKKSPSSTTGSLEGSTKSRKKKKQEPKGEQEEEPKVMKANDVQERSDDEMSKQAKSEEKDGKSEEESEKDKKKRKKKKQSSNKSLSNKESAGKLKTKKSPVSERSSPPIEKTPSNSSEGSKKNDDNEENPEEYSKKKTTEVVKGKKSTSKKPSSKDNTGKKVLNGKGHKKADKLKPSDAELRSAICEVLKEVDFNTATFADIVKILAQRYDTDLTPRKTSVKNMIQDELTRLVDEADEEDEEENAEVDEKQPSVQGVEA